MDRSLPPWLIIDDGYIDITNAHTKNGTLAKRHGYRSFAQFTEFATENKLTIGAFTPGPTLTLTVANHAIIEGTLAQVNGMSAQNLPPGPTYSVHVIDQDHVELRDLSGQSLSSNNSNSYQSGGFLYTCNGIASVSQGQETIITTLYPHNISTTQKLLLQNVQGMAQINGIMFKAEVIDSLNVKLFYIGGQSVDSTEFDPLTGPGAIAVESAHRVRAFANSFNAEGDELLVVFGQSRLCVYDENQSLLKPLTFYDAYSTQLQILTASFNKKIWFAGYGVPLQSIDTATLITQSMYPQIGPNSNDLVTQANGVFAFAGRLLLFCPTQSGTDFGQKRQRMLFSAQIAPDNQTVPFGVNDWRIDLPGNGGYVDFDCDESFVGVAPVKSAFIVYFTKSVWRVRETPKSSQPFIVEKVQALRAAAGPKSMLGFEQSAASLGQETLLATDGNSFQRLDEKIPNWLQSEIDQNDFADVTAARDEINRQIIWSYPHQESYQALVLSEGDVSFSRYRFALGILGNYLTPDFSPAWNNYDGVHMAQETWDSLDANFNSYQLQERVPVLIGGDDFGQIYYLNQGNSDNGSPISMRLVTKELNPYLSLGVKARLGYVDFLVQVDQDAEFTATFYADSSQNPYLSITVPCTAAGGNQRSMKRVFKRVPCNQTANFHTIRIEQSSNISSFCLEGIVPYFAQTSSRMTT